LETWVRYKASPDTVVYEESYATAVRVSGALSDGLVCFAAPSDSGKAGRWWGKDYPGEMMPFGRDQAEVDLACRNGYRNTIALIDEAVFRDSYQRCVGREPDFLASGGNFIPLRPGRLKTLRCEINAALPTSGDMGQQPAAPCSDDEFTASVVESVARAIGEEVEIRMSQSQKRRLLEQAREIAIQSNFRISIYGLCRTLGVSKRSLEYAFQSYLQTSPARYFRMLRFNHCFKRLLAADPARHSVKEFALELGFTDLGRFAGLYRKFFGEYPSQTLKRRPNKSAPKISIGRPGSERSC
jgi:AraC family ethanolamine operon transcriptional activator